MAPDATTEKIRDRNKVGLFYFILFFVSYFGFACDYGNSFFALERKKEKVSYWIEVRTFFFQ